ncbi:MAG: hypothetical protein D6751_01960 [Deltaproteobacteria bacterium]|nr:MAG: hypothetical protein D6751_01960 [Deltaproteobacteria bacterium]
MKKSSPNRSDWIDLVARLQGELTALEQEEIVWLLRQVERIERLQRSLHELALSADAEAVCADCRGACCERGLHHLNLANLLSFLLRGESPPAPDFFATCPMLGTSGCLLPVERRPFNCVTFICESVEDRLDPEARERFYRLEAQLREIYGCLAGRYPAATLRGIWIYLERHPGGRILSKG